MIFILKDELKREARVLKEIREKLTANGLFG